MHTHTGHLGFCFVFLRGKTQPKYKGLINLLLFYQKLMTLLYQHGVYVTDLLAILCPVMKINALEMCVLTLTEKTGR